MNFFKKLKELNRLLGYNKVYNNLEKKNIYFGPKNAPECTSGHAKFQNHLGEVPQTPQQEGETPPHILIASTPHLCSGYLRFSSCYFFTN